MQESSRRLQNFRWALTPRSGRSVRYRKEQVFWVEDWCCEIAQNQQELWRRSKRFSYQQTDADTKTFHFFILAVIYHIKSTNQRGSDEKLALISSNSSNLLPVGLCSVTPSAFYAENARRKTTNENSQIEAKNKALTSSCTWIYRTWKSFAKQHHHRKIIAQICCTIEKQLVAHTRLCASFHIECSTACSSGGDGNSGTRKEDSNNWVLALWMLQPANSDSHTHKVVRIGLNEENLGRTSEIWALALKLAVIITVDKLAWTPYQSICQWMVVWAFAKARLIGFID